MKAACIRLIKNTFLTTGLTLFLLAIFAFLSGGSAVFIRTIFQDFAANICIHLILLLSSKFESKYFMLDMAIDISAACFVILVFGAIFDWFSSTPPWILISMVLIIYVLGLGFQIFRVHDDIRFINEKLKKHRDNKNKQGVL